MGLRWTPVGFVEDGKDDFAHRDDALARDCLVASGHGATPIVGGTTVPHHVELVAGIAGA